MVGSGRVRHTGGDSAEKKLELVVNVERIAWSYGMRMDDAFVRVSTRGPEWVSAVVPNVTMLPMRRPPGNGKLG